MSMLCSSVVAFLAVGPLGANGAVKVAVVNVPAVSERYQRTADLEAQFERRRQQLNEQRTAMNDKIERTRQSLREELQPGSEAHAARRKELALLEAEMQFFMESEGKTIELQMAASLRSIFDDIQAVIREVAEGGSIDLVLAADKLPDNPPESTAQVRQQIVLQKVLFWRPQIDITDEVVARLNARYNAQKAEQKP